MEDLANFARLMEAMRPWLGHVVIVGGWAHWLHRFHPLATVPEYQPLRTRDVDLAFSPDAPLHGDLRKAPARIPQDRRLQPENVRAAIEHGLEEVFGPVVN